MLAPEVIELPPVEPLMDYSTAREKLKALIDAWEPQREYTESCRRMRKVDVDVQALQSSGILKQDETIIPIRTIDTNIKREQPAYVGYLKQARRLAVFKNLENIQQNTELIEENFTLGMTYKNWEIPWFKVIDGAQLCGWDSVEVEFDTNRPLHAGLDHIGNENLIFPLDTKNIQACELVIRRYEITTKQLERFVTQFGFNKEQVDMTVAKNRSEKDKDRCVEIFKCWFRDTNGVVFVAWFDNKSGTDWLKSPAKLFLGRRVQGQPMFDMLGNEMPGQMEDVDETEYPVAVLLYGITEEPYIIQSRGRAFYDQPRQEAQTGLWSSCVNGALRASNVYGSPGQPDATGGKLSRVDVNLEPGIIYNQPLTFWSTPYPSDMLIKAAQTLDTQTQQETGQTNFAVNNREDSRKTATEIQAANVQASLLSSVQVSMFSTFVREVYCVCWKIVQAQAIQEVIPFLQVELTVVDPLGVPSTKRANNIPGISQNYDIRAAGDVDVVQRAEKLQRMQSMWQIVAATGAAPVFLLNMLKTMFPEDAKMYEQALQQGSAEKQLIGNLGNVIKTLVTDEAGGLKPEYQAQAQQLQQLEQQVTATLQGGQPQ